MKDIKKRIKELAKEIANDEKGLANVIQEMNALQTKAAGIDRVITSRKGGLFELEKLEK